MELFAIGVGENDIKRNNSISAGYYFDSTKNIPYLTIPTHLKSGSLGASEPIDTGNYGTVANVPTGSMFWSPTDKKMYVWNSDDGIWYSSSAFNT